MKKRNLVLIIICIALIVMPFVVNRHGEFAGADDQAAIGAGFIGYFVGKKRGQSDKANKSVQQ